MLRTLHKYQQSTPSIDSTQGASTHCQHPWHQCRKISLLWTIVKPTDNAYASGMSEDLNFHGNELVHFQIMYNLGAVLGQLPFALLFPKIRMIFSYLLLIFFGVYLHFSNTDRRVIRRSWHIDS
jgi:hypothetical protein